MKALGDVMKPAELPSKSNVHGVSDVWRSP